MLGGSVNGGSASFGVESDEETRKVLPMHENFPSHLLYDKEDLISYKFYRYVEKYFFILHFISILLLFQLQ